MQKRLSDYQSTMDPVALENCQIKRARCTDDMEIILKSTSQVQMSPQKFPKHKVATFVNENISLDCLERKGEYDNVTVSAKVLYVEEPVQVSSISTIQEVTIADASAAAKLTLWQDNLNAVEEGNCYEFKNVVVRVFRNEQYLSIPKEGASITHIDDIGDVADDDLPRDKMIILDARVVAATLLLLCGM